MMKHQVFACENSTKWDIWCVQIYYWRYYSNATDIIIVLLLCTSLLLLFIPRAKWYNVHRSRNSKHGNAPYRTISWEFSKNYKSAIFQKPLWMVTFLLKQWHRRLKDQVGETMGQNIGKYDFFCMISTTLTKTGGGEVTCFIL